MKYTCNSYTHARSVNLDVSHACMLDINIVQCMDDDSKRDEQQRQTGKKAKPKQKQSKTTPKYGLMCEHK